MAPTRPCSRSSIRAGEGLAEGLVGVVVGIVHEQDVDALEAEPLEAGLEAAQDAIAGEVEVPGLGAADVLP